jgi:hypothetical protein
VEKLPLISKVWRGGKKASFSNPSVTLDFNPLATEFFFQILAHPVFKM